MDKIIKTPILPSVNQLFSDGWILLKKSYIKLLQLYLIAFGLIFGIVVVLLIIAAIFGVGSVLLNISKITPQTNLGPVIIVAGMFGLIAFAAFIIILSALQIATLLVVSGKTTHQSPLKIFEQSFSFIGPRVGAGICSTLLVLGGLFLFIIPGILFSLFFTFLSYEVVLNKQSGVEALKRSYLIFSKNFWGILGRMLLLVLVSLIISGILSSITKNSGGLSGLFSLISFVVNIAFAWFSVCYNYLIYKEASVGLEDVHGKSITWIAAVSIIGWVIAILIAFLVYTAFNTYKDRYHQPVMQPTIQPLNMESTGASSPAY